MSEKLKGYIVCSRCGEKFPDMEKIIFILDLPVCTGCEHKKVNSDFINANERQLEKWD